MSNQVWRVIIAVVLIAHGIGHTLGLFPIFGWAKSDVWTGRSWLLSGLLGESVAQWIGVVVWLAAAFGFIAAGLSILGILVPQDWWRTLIIASAIVSLVGVVLFWEGFPGIGSKAGAIIVDVAALVLLLWVHWPTPEIVGM